MSKKKSSEEPGRRVHKAGKFCGYDTDGTRIWPAPTYTEPLERLKYEQESIDQLLRSVNAYALQALADVKAKIGGVLDRLSEDYGLVRGEFAYHWGDSSIRPILRSQQPAIDPDKPKSGDAP